MQSFGTATRSFSIQKLNTFIESENIGGAKEYILKYFAKIQNPVGVIVWEPANDSLRHYTDTEIRTRFLFSRGRESPFDPATCFFFYLSSFLHTTDGPITGPGISS